MPEKPRIFDAGVLLIGATLMATPAPALPCHLTNDDSDHLRIPPAATANQLQKRVSIVSRSQIKTNCAKPGAS